MIDYKTELKKRNQGPDWVAVRLLEISEKTELSGDDRMFLQLCAGIVIGTDSKVIALETKLKATLARGERMLCTRRYQWLRDGNAYGPEENGVGGGKELDDYCDMGIAADREGEHE